MEIVREKTEKIPGLAGEKLISLVSFDEPILLLLSGGSALEMLFFAKNILQHPNLTIGMLDDRAVADKSKNNFCSLLETDFGKKMLEMHIPVIDTALREKESPAQMARRFANSLIAWRRANPKGKIIVTMGIGGDGHTAGIFPFPESPRFSKDMFESEEWIACYDASGKHEITMRLTVTHTFLRDEVFGAIVYVLGKNKQNALEKILAEDGGLVDVPGRIIRDMKNVSIFTDIG